MKKFYFAPECAILTFNAGDIIATSATFRISLSENVGSINEGDCIDFD